MNRICRVISWIVLSVMLCLGLSGALAEAAGETQAEYEVLSSLLEAFDREPPAGNVLDEEGAAAYCLKIYSYINPDRVEGVFYGGPEELTLLLKSLSATIFGAEIWSDMGFESAVYYYATIWEILHGDFSSQAKSRPVAKQTMKGIFSECSDEAISQATDLCYDYIGLYEPELVNSGYEIGTNETTIEGSEEYRAYYQQGFELFEAGKYEEAIEAYSKCLEYQENDMTASFEIVEAYIALRDYASAKDRLAQIAPYLTENRYIAQWLRRQGFIAIEELDYEAAAAFYTYSQEYEQSSLAEQELQYIRYAAPAAKEFTAEEAAAYLEENGIVFAKEDNK